MQVDKARLEKSTASLRRAQEVAALSSTRLPRPDVGGFDNKCLSQCRSHSQMISSGAHTKTSEKQLVFRFEDVPTEDHEDGGGDRAHSRRGAVRVKAEKRGTF